MFHISHKIKYAICVSPQTSYVVLCRNSLSTLSNVERVDGFSWTGVPSGGGCGSSTPTERCTSQFCTVVWYLEGVAESLSWRSCAASVWLGKMQEAKLYLIVKACVSECWSEEAEADFPSWMGTREPQSSGLRCVLVRERKGLLNKPRYLIESSHSASAL